TNSSCIPANATAAMTDDTPLPFDLPAVCRKKLTVDFNGGAPVVRRRPAASARSGTQDGRMRAACGGDAGLPRSKPHPAWYFGDADGPLVGNREGLWGCDRPGPSAA